MRSTGERSPAFREQLEAEWQLRFDQVRGEIVP